MTRSQRLCVAVMAVLLALVVNQCVLTVAVAQHIHVPGTKHLVPVVPADSLGNAYELYEAEIDSVVMRTYLVVNGVATLWRVDYGDSLGPGLWGKVIDADSAGVQGDYVCRSVIYTVQGRTPPSVDRWQVSDDFDIFGNVPVTIVCVDTSQTPDAAVPAATVTVRSSDGWVVAHGRANSAGVFSFTYPEPDNPDTLLVGGETVPGGVQFPAAESLFVYQTAVTDSLLGYEFDPGDPVNPMRVMAVGYLQEGTGQGVPNVTIECELVVPPGYTNIPTVTSTGAFVMSPFDTTTAADGTFVFELYRNSDITPANTQWRVTTKYTDYLSRRRYKQQTFSIGAADSSPYNIGKLGG